jgi:Ca2+/Na+ antiporter
MEEIINAFITSFSGGLPALLWGTIVFLIGWFIAKKIKKGVKAVLDKIRINQMLKTLGWEDFFDRYDTRLDMSGFIGSIIEVFFVIVFLSISFEIVRLDQVNVLLQEIINYFPNIFISIIIFIIAVFLADFSKKIVLVKMEKRKMSYSGIVGNVVATSTWIICTLAILYQLQIVQTLVLAIFIGFIALLVLILGLAFGLGGKDMAARMLKDLEDKVK